MGIKALGYLVVTTKDPAEWDRFLTALVGAMRVADSPDGAALYRVDDRVFRFRIEKGDEERSTAAAYELGDADELAALRKRIAAAGRPVVDGTADGAGPRSCRLLPHERSSGKLVEFFHGDSRTGEPFVSPLGVPGFVTGELGMGHAVFCAPDFAATVAFYRDVVGFHETDMPRFYFGGGGADDAGIGFAFLHADNGRHHSIALGEGPVPELAASTSCLSCPACWRSARRTTG